VNVAHADDPSPPVDPKLCKALVNYQTPPGVNYQPGVDVNGNKVAPADLPASGSQMKLPDKIYIPLTASLTKVLNLDTTKYPASVLGPSTEAQLGVFTVEGNHVSFNGQPLSDAQADELAALCAKQKPAP
jgi:hypothetical protein